MNRIPFAGEEEEPVEDAEMLERAPDEFDQYQEAADRHEQEVDNRPRVDDDDGDQKVPGFGYAQLGDREIKALTGFTQPEFAELCHALQEGLAIPGLGKKGRRPKKMMQPEDRLLLALTWLRHAEQFRRLAAMFGLSKSQCYTLVMSTVKQLAPVAVSEYVTRVSHHAQSEAGELSHVFPQATIVIDSKTQACTRPVGSFHDAKRYFSHKHNKYGLKTLTIHSMNGRVVHISDTVPGSVADITLASSPEVKRAVSHC